MPVEAIALDDAPPLRFHAREQQHQGSHNSRALPNVLRHVLGRAVQRLRPRPSLPRRQPRCQCRTRGIQASPSRSRREPRQAIAAKAWCRSSRAPDPRARLRTVQRFRRLRSRCRAGQSPRGGIGPTPLRGARRQIANHGLQLRSRAANAIAQSWRSATDRIQALSCG
jgi:hypothetical protein